MDKEKRNILHELHRAARRNFPRRRVILKGIALWQADLVEMGPYSSVNDGYRYMLTIIDTFSKKGWAVPIKSKRGDEVRKAMQSIFVKGRKPKNLQTDDGTEFFNKQFQGLVKRYNINYYSTYSALKASIVERFNCTLKNMTWKEFSVNGSYRLIDLIQSLINTYNN